MYAIFRPLLFRLDPEVAHLLASGTARIAQTVAPSLIAPLFGFEHPMLQQSLWGKPFANPVGLAAGFDKNARLVRFWARAGFGYCEVGSVSARACAGNPKPRAFRLPMDRALINRMGLNNDGAEEISRRLKKLPLESLPPLGINLVKTHDPEIMGNGAIVDFRHSFRLLAGLADYVVLNISCPNTLEGKTFEDPESLHTLLTAIMADREEMRLRVPILIKLSPTFSRHVVYDSAIEETIAVALELGVEGLIANNTASDRDELRTPAQEVARIGRGGLSGAPLTARTTRLVQYLHLKTGGKIPIIAVGGIDSAETAYANIRAGASLVQLYTGLVYRGPGVVKRINRGLVRLLKQDGFAHLRDAIGVDSASMPANPVAPEVLEPATVA
ncbi:MAG: quinone-dependent dihydroorotate dehydrogenase [Rhodothermales bacterium]|nr:quinone-dependent dihydroorotate dehydrogenase [Rhodothermales bacterium]